ncbi:MAG: hypothetical protein EP345_17415 [Sphingomonadales bacterium]|nr:MAG: hypothetical protein EP345_17415 [Sphingomonadales bacterium]
MSNWLRIYSEVLNDPKVQKLPAETFKGWINILCLAAQNDGALPSDDDIAFALRIDGKRAEKLMKQLSDAGLIDVSETGRSPHNWNGRQYKSDVSTERVKRFRERSKKQSETATETPPEQSRNRAEAEAEQKRANETQPDDHRVVDLAHELATVAGCCLPDHGRIVENQTIVRGWLNAGADPVGLRALVADRIASGRAQPRTLRYFDAAVRDSIAQKSKQEDGCMKMVRQILREQAA